MLFATFPGPLNALNHGLSQAKVNQEGVGAKQAFRPSDGGFPPDRIHHHLIGQGDAKGVYAKELHIPAGFFLVSHRHAYDHLAILASGSVDLSVRSQETTTTSRLNGPTAIAISRGDEHTVRAITDAVWFCIHPTDETDPARVDEAILKGP